MEQLTFLDCLIYGEFSFFSEAVYVTIGNPAFCLAFYLTGVHFRSELQHIGDVSEQKNHVLTNQNPWSR